MSNLNSSTSNLPDSSGRPFTTSFSGQSGSVQGLHNIHGNYSLPNMPGSLAQRNAAMSRLPSSGVQQPGGSISGRFASNNLPVAMSLVRMPAFVEIPHAHSATMEAPPRHLPDELLEEILLRLPPDDPACLLRASLVCKDWSGIVCGPRFRRRLHELHRTPPVLGFLHNCWEEDGRIPRFIHTTASPSFSLATLDLYTWRALDCRHRRALFFPQESDALEMQMLLWDPITGAQQRIPVPAAFRSDDLFPRAAVLCAADRCDHRDCCFGGPFRVVFLFEDNVLDLEGQIVIWACVYSSETGAWGLPTSLHTEDFLGVTENSSVLLGGSLYFDMNGWSILEYDLAKHAMSVFSPPDVRGSLHLNRINLMLTEDGRLGAIVQDLGTCLKLFTIEASGAGTDARWVLSWIMDLRHVLPTSARLNQGFTVRVMGFAEGANIIFVNSVGAGIFTIELQSLKVRKACDDSIDPLVPLVTFYTPMPRDHQECSR